MRTLPRMRSWSAWVKSFGPRRELGQALTPEEMSARYLDCLARRAGAA